MVTKHTMKTFGGIIWENLSAITSWIIYNTCNRHLIIYILMWWIIFYYLPKVQISKEHIFLIDKNLRFSLSCDPKLSHTKIQFWRENFFLSCYKFKFLWAVLLVTHWSLRLLDWIVVKVWKSNKNKLKVTKTNHFKNNIKNKKQNV